MSVSTSRAKPIPPAEPTDSNGAIPPLKQGDRLTRDEFERRYDSMPNLKKAELIERVVYVPSPVRCEDHGEPHLTLGGWLFNYRVRTPGVRAADNASVRLDLDSMPQPDCLLFVVPSTGARPGSTTMITSTAHRTSSQRSPPARPTTIGTTCSKFIVATASANTSSGACSIGRSIGSS